MIIIAPFATLMGFVTYKAWRAKHKEGVMIEPVTADKTGFVLVGGEYWQAKTKGESLSRGQKVRVVEKQDAVLLVEPFPDSNPLSE
jgi:membrane-bound ClpP family serine protease